MPRKTAPKDTYPVPRPFLLEHRERGPKGWMSQEDVVDRIKSLGVHTTTASLSRWEKGSHPLNTRQLAAIAEVLGTDIASILMGPPGASFQELAGAVMALPAKDRKRVIASMLVFARPVDDEEGSQGAVAGRRRPRRRAVAQSAKSAKRQRK